MYMNVLLLGSGGREHAFAYKLAQSNSLNKLFIAPGNAGTAQSGTNVNLSVTDFESIQKFVIGHQINFVVVGPEDPLVTGIADYFQQTSVLKTYPRFRPSKSRCNVRRQQGFFEKIYAEIWNPYSKLSKF
jgi:phosphoribosylamine--glycine ligase